MYSLVIGTGNNGNDTIDYSKHGYTHCIDYDNNKINSDNKIFIADCIDFNNFEQLNNYSSKYFNKFNKIILDLNVSKLLQWDIKFLKCIYDMLSDHGIFYFDHTQYFNIIISNLDDVKPILKLNKKDKKLEFDEKYEKLFVLGIRNIFFDMSIPSYDDIISRNIKIFENVGFVVEKYFDVYPNICDLNSNDKIIYIKASK